MRKTIIITAVAVFLLTACSPSTHIVIITPNTTPTPQVMPSATRFLAPIPTKTPRPSPTDTPITFPATTPTASSPTPILTVAQARMPRTSTPVLPAARASAAPTTTAQKTPDPIADAYPCLPGQIKANRNSNIYHVPTGVSYAKTRANVLCFDTEAAAQAAGYNRAKR